MQIDKSLVLDELRKAGKARGSLARFEPGRRKANQVRSADEPCLQVSGFT